MADYWELAFYVYVELIGRLNTCIHDVFTRLLEDIKWHYTDYNPIFIPRLNFVKSITVYIPVYCIFMYVNSPYFILKNLHVCTKKLACCFFNTYLAQNWKN